VVAVDVGVVVLAVEEELVDVLAGVSGGDVLAEGVGFCGRGERGCFLLGQFFLGCFESFGDGTAGSLLAGEVPSSSLRSTLEVFRSPSCGAAFQAQARRPSSLRTWFVVACATAGSFFVSA